MFLASHSRPTTFCSVLFLNSHTCVFFLCISGTVNAFSTLTNFFLCVFMLEDMPEEVNIDDLLDLSSDEERTHKLQVP